MIERAGELVIKEELGAKVGPNTFVAKSSLWVHMAALRRTLVDHQARNRYIASVAGRGYRFVATRSRVEEALPVAASAAAAMEEPTHNLPMPATRTIGRAKIVTSLVSYLPRWRSITLVWAGDIGETTVALAMAERLRAVRWRRCEKSLRC